MSKMQRKPKDEGRTELPEQTGSPQTEAQPSPAISELSNAALFEKFQDYLERVNQEAFAYLSPYKQNLETRMLAELKQEIERRGLVETVPSLVEEPKKDLAKVMTNDETPRCPFCLSVKLEPITFPNPWGRKWVCRDCCSAFREPTTKGKVA